MPRARARARVYSPPYCIQIDTREQAPYRFDGMRTRESRGELPIKVGTWREMIPAGDYSIHGSMNRISIERKTLVDLKGTIGKGRDRFERELDLLNVLEYAAVVVEATFKDILEDTGKIFSPMQPAVVEGSIMAYTLDFPKVHWFLCQSRVHAQHVTFRLLDRFYRLCVNPEWKPRC